MNRRVLVTALATVAVAAGCGTESGTESAGTTSPTTSPTTSSSSSAPSTPPSSVTPTSTPERAVDPLAGAPALWPFGSIEEARQWQARGEGHSPWHLDAEATALSFTTGYLGFDGVDQVVASEIGAAEATVTVGYQGELPEPAPAAVLRLVRYGDGPKAPWQVVGTVDESITITSPEPGAVVGSPIEVAGTISGVDESIRVQVRDPDVPTPVGEECCLPAGGEDTPWSVTVTVRGASDATLTIVAATGGHVADVERFAVTGVRPAP